MQNIILVCVAIFLPLGLVVANKLIDRATIKQKDDTIENLKKNVISLVTEKTIAQNDATTAQRTSQQVSSLAQEQVDIVKTTAPLMEQAKSVVSEADAIELARRQVEAQK